MEKVHLGHLYKSKIINGRETRYFHSVQAQELFDRVRHVAKEKGMQLNAQKTTLLCLSAATSYDAKTYINCDSDIILSSSKCRLLGFHFDGTPSVGAHVREVLKKVRYRMWSIHFWILKP